MPQAIKTPREAKTWAPMPSDNDDETPFPWRDAAEADGSDTGSNRVRVSVAVVVEVFLPDGSLEGRYRSAARRWWPQ